jgi:hypothetical protein
LKRFGAGTANLTLGACHQTSPGFGCAHFTASSFQQLRWSTWLQPFKPRPPSGGYSVTVAASSGRTARTTTSVLMTVERINTHGVFQLLNFKPAEEETDTT